MHSSPTHRIFVVYGIHLHQIVTGIKRIDMISLLEASGLTEEFNFGHNLFHFYSASKHAEKKMTMIFISEEFKVSEVRFLDTP